MVRRKCFRTFERRENYSKDHSNKKINQISKRFAARMHKGNVKGAVKVLTSNMQNGILPLNARKKFKNTVT